MKQYIIIGIISIFVGYLCSLIDFSKEYQSPKTLVDVLEEWRIQDNNCK